MDITQLRIKLPYDMMLEEQKEKQDKAYIFSFLIDFKEKINKFNRFLEFFTSYPTILQEHKHEIRNRIRQIKQDYYEFHQKFPQHNINMFEKQSDVLSKDICTIYSTITTLISIMNTHIQCISEKTVIY
jgi:hypothetical protein